MSQKKRYTDDLTDQEWDLIAPLVLEKKSKAGRKSLHPKREMLNAIFYLLRSGCTWRDLPPWTAVQSQFRRWKEDSTFLKIHDYLRSRLRRLIDHPEHPTVAISKSSTVFY